MDLQPETWSLIGGASIGLAGIAVSVYTTRAALRHSERMENRKDLRRALTAVATARFRMVTAILELAHCATHAKDVHLNLCRERYEDLRLAVQTQCHLQEMECLADAARRFKFAILDPVAQGKLVRAGAIAKRTREVASDFNTAFDVAARGAGMAPTAFAFRGAGHSGS